MKRSWLLQAVLVASLLGCSVGETTPLSPSPHLGLSQSVWPIIHHSPDQEAASPYQGPPSPEEGGRAVDFLRDVQGPAPVLFDSRGDILAMGVDAFSKAHVFTRLDPEDLSVKSTYRVDIANPLEGLYSFLDSQDCWWNGYYQVISRICFRGEEMFEDVHIDLSSSYPDLLTSDDSIVGIMPLYRPRALIDVAFVTQGLKTVHEGGSFTKRTIGAKAGLLRLHQDRTHDLVLRTFPDENITNNFAVDPEDGIYVLTNRHAWKLSPGEKELDVVWSYPYEAGEPIPSIPCRDTVPDDLCALLAIKENVKFGDGSGTTPTLIGKDRRYLAFADGSRPMRLIVLRTADGSEVFVDDPIPIKQGRAQTENTIAAFGNTFAIESNYTKGVAGYEIAGDYGEETVLLKWVNTEIFAPNAVPLVSGASNTLYVYEAQGDDPWSGFARWFVTALDLDSGTVLWRTFIGTGLSYNSLYAPLCVDDRRRIYIGLFGGLMRLR